MLQRLVYSLGVRIRNPKIFERYRFLIDSQTWDLARIEKHQYEMLISLLHHAYDNSIHYRQKFDKAGIRPDDIESLDDLDKIPLLTKEELLTHVARIQIRDGAEKLFYSETSGSTGRPLVFYRNADWDAWHRASVFRGYSWHGVSPWERNGYLWGYNFALRRRIKTQFLDFLQNRFRLFSYKDEEIRQFVRKLRRASYLGGYSSMIYEVAKAVNRLGEGPLSNLKMVKGTSEKIFDRYQIEAERAFARRIISEYGAAEAGIIAFECPSGNMHVNMETTLVEEENSEIIVTNLVSRSCPIIRFKLGDYIEIDKRSKCECGKQHYIIRDVLGRVGKVIYGFREQYPSLTLYYVFKNLAMEHDIILNYQAIQKERGHLDVSIENELRDSAHDLLRREFEKYFADDLHLTISDRAELRSSNKKKADFVSEIGDIQEPAPSG